jgi:DNA-binding IclR family transcriptional regulator
VRQVLGQQAIRHASRVGRALPLDRTAIVAALTGHVNGTGYAAKREAFERDVTAVAAPVYGLDGAILAAFRVSCPSYRIAEVDLKRLGEFVATEARSASAELCGAVEGAQPRASPGKQR